VGGDEEGEGAATGQEAEDEGAATGQEAEDEGPATGQEAEDKALATERNRRNPIDKLPLCVQIDIARFLIRT
jgi:hypothetical protein